ncbi:MAG: cation:proton antiporter [Nitrososphaerota archaeon]
MEPILRAIVSISVLVFFAKIFGGIFSNFKLPPIVGELLAGLLLSPILLGGSIIIFKEPLVVLNEYVDAFAEIGAIMILFSSGLEMGMTSLRKTGVWSFLIASLGALLPFIGGYYLSMWLGYSQETASMIGSIMVATSLAITTRVLEDFDALKTIEGELLVNAAVIDDVIGVSVLAIISSAIEKPGQGLNIFTALETVSIFFIIWLLMLGIGAYFVPRFLEHVMLIKAEGAVEAAAVGIAFIMSAIAAGLGLSPIIGSYAAGLAIAESRALVRVKDFVRHLNQIFSPLFFTVVGAKMNITVVGGHVVFGTLLFTAMAFISKFAGSFIAALPKLKNIMKSVRLGVGMVPRGELGLVIAALALKEMVIDQNIYVESIGMVMLTSIIAPIILSILYRREAI